MNRRSFLKLIGLTPALPLVKFLPEAEEKPEEPKAKEYKWEFSHGFESGYFNVYPRHYIVED